MIAQRTNCEQLGIRDSLDHAPPAEETAATGNSQAAVWHPLDYLVLGLCSVCARRDAQQGTLPLLRDALSGAHPARVCFQSRAVGRSIFYCICILGTWQLHRWSINLLLCGGFF